MADSGTARVEASAAAIRSTIPTMTKRSSCMTDHTSARSLPSEAATHPGGVPQDLLNHLQQPESVRKTYLYLGYGSNLSNEKFRGDRGIKPLSQVNVQVPTLRLTFDLPGIPYAEPCFANSGTRDPDNDPPPNAENEKSPLIAKEDRYHKDRWHKGLIGVVYEVTAEDYAHIIATEGGGASYHDITVDCHPLPLNKPDAPVPQNPTLPPFKAHTLFAPAVPPNEPPPKDGGRFQRPDMSYAQPSARYLKLMTDGAKELGLPYEYQDYLLNIRSYTVTTARQRVGSYIFLAVWGPIVAAIFALGKMFADDKGRIPTWLRSLLGAIFKAVWLSYDYFFKQVFGDGERTLTDGGNDEGDGDGDDERLREKRRVSESKAKDHLLQEEDQFVRQMV
ncbi:uncharacterized protein LTR77_010199 [Saxophila tyrrhenica]|uniref:gamma-glutamylcyclotransferase n=1 Tax=Saxophila tyrrhenica TaxID=1690608 RepID=A0AAV9NWR2_9PEZI|nr:hypothetical protein LTR77_010199 [Saxophila tyrrhenica]